MCARDCGGGGALQRGSGGSSGRTRQGHGGDRDLGVAQITFENGNFSLQEEGLGVTVWGRGSKEAWWGPWTEDEAEGQTGDAY